MKITSIVLAGGKSLRMDRNKILETIDGKSLIERVIERVRPVSNQILIVTAQEQQALLMTCQAEVLVDIYPGKGPLGGIYTGLLASRSSYSLVVAGDMPFLNIKLLQYMTGLSQDCDAIVPRMRDRKAEPLHAIYAKSCLNVMKTLLEHNQLEVNRFLNTVRVRYVEQEEAQRLDPQLLSFFNINSPADLEQAVKLAMQRSS